MKKVIYLLALVLIFPRKADAYLDPGTGSYLLQILAAGALATLFFFKSWWRRLKNLILKIFKKGEES